MENTINRTSLVTQIGTSIRILLVTMAICSFIYPLVLLSIGQTLTPNSANGSLIINDQIKIVGSKLIAQRFVRAEYFWPRPSAVEYNASAAAGSNLSPTSPLLRVRAMELIERLNGSDKNPIPADLVTASASGIDPDITLTAAIFQAERVARARGLEPEIILGLLDSCAYRPGGVITSQKLVNVLSVNLALDKLSK